MGDWTGAERAACIVVVLLAGMASVYLVLDTWLLESLFAGALLFLGGLGSFALAYRWGLTRDRAFLWLWVAASTLTAAVSIVTGYHNGLTDEPYATPQFLQLWPNLYATPLHLSYYQYGSGPHVESVYYPYLPFLPWLQIPGLDYRWVAFGSWLLILLLIRRNGSGLTLLASPWVGFLAASGFNDFVPLLVLTLTFVSLTGWPSRVAEILALGLKQFSNVVVVAYYLVRRQWWEALFATGVTVAVLIPFALLDASGVWCHAVLLQSASCGSGPGPAYGAAFLGHLNYFVWPIFVFAIFGPRYAAILRGPGYERNEPRPHLSSESRMGEMTGRGGMASSWSWSRCSGSGAISVPRGENGDERVRTSKRSCRISGTCAGPRRRTHPRLEDGRAMTPDRPAVSPAEM